MGTQLSYFTPSQVSTQRWLTVCGYIIFVFNQATISQWVAAMNTGEETASSA